MSAARTPSGAGTPLQAPTLLALLERRAGRVPLVTPRPRSRFEDGGAGDDLTIEEVPVDAAPAAEPPIDAPTIEEVPTDAPSAASPVGRPEQPAAPAAPAGAAGTRAAPAAADAPVRPAGRGDLPVAPAPAARASVGAAPPDAAPMTTAPPASTGGRADAVGSRVMRSVDAPVLAPTAAPIAGTAPPPEGSGRQAADAPRPAAALPAASRSLPPSPADRPAPRRPADSGGPAREAATGPSTRAPTRRSPVPQGQAAPSSAPVVEVRIGRLVVDARPAEDVARRAARRPARVRRPGPDLEAYLAGRGGGESS